jgi:hypothetical protein
MAKIDSRRLALKFVALAGFGRRFSGFVGEWVWSHKTPR